VSARPHPTSWRGLRSPHGKLTAGAGVLDVTLRDGGYLCDWRFPDVTVTTLVELLDRIGVPYIEVGYISDDASRPPVLRCCSDYLMRVKQACAQARIVAMLSTAGASAAQLVRSVHSRRDVVDVVRLTCLLPDVGPVLMAAELVRGAGIVCSINLISITAFEPEELLAAVRRIDEAGVADWLYLADSRGALLPQTAASLFGAVRREWPGVLGYHAHDNLRAAVTNSRLALEAGFDLVDASINGYGLGGGNTELLAALELVAACGDDDAWHVERVANLIARDLPPRPAYECLYPLTGLKNLEQEWAPDVWDAHGAGSEAFLRALPWRRYRCVGEVLDA
jgi:4-hydroxy 2-oxovalerate aldolase